MPNSFEYARDEEFAIVAKPEAQQGVVQVRRYGLIIATVDEGGVKG